MKKYFPYILISAVILAAVFGPLGAHLAQAGFLEAFTQPGQFVLSILAELGNVILWLVGRVLWLVAHLFDFTLKLSLDSGTFSKIAAVEQGWAICRDIANLFFIFILLYIAIATILQLSGYGMKELLTTVIIIALMVNFSLMITKVIIDSSNILAMEFYNKVGVEENGVLKPDITSVMMEGLKLQGIFQGAELKNPANSSENEKDKLTLGTIITGTILGSLLILVTAFVFLAATILFIIRTIVLLFLMILSPLAFLFMIMPATKGYASTWWQTLFKQSFFAPAFMFMIYLVAFIVKTGGLNTITASSGGDPQASLAGAFTGTTPSAVGSILNFVLLIGLMISALIIAQKMGAYGSSTVMGWGQKMKGAAQGWAGKVPGRLARRAAAPLAEKVATSEAGWARTIRGIPLVGKGLAKGAAGIAEKSRARVAELQKGYEKYTDLELKNMIPTLMPFNRTAVVQELASRGKLKGKGPLALDDKEIMRSRKIMERYGMSTKDVDKQRPDLVPDEPHPTVPGKTKREVAIESLFPSDIEKVGEKLFTDQVMRGVAVKSFGSSHAQKILDRGGEAEKQFFTHIASLGRDIDAVANNLTAMGNKSLAGWVRSGPAAKAVVESYM